jgi:RNA polymerase sigma-70 factor (ECF subfamily)
MHQMGLPLERTPDDALLSGLELALLLDMATRTPEWQALADETSAEVCSAVGCLPREQARALVMAGIYGMTAQQVADLEDVPLGTAKSRMPHGKFRVSLATISRTSRQEDGP